MGDSLDENFALSREFGGVDSSSECDYRPDPPSSLDHGSGPGSPQGRSPSSAKKRRAEPQQKETTQSVKSQKKIRLCASSGRSESADVGGCKVSSNRKSGADRFAEEGPTSAKKTERANSERGSAKVKKGKPPALFQKSLFKKLANSPCCSADEQRGVLTMVMEADENRKRALNLESSFFVPHKESGHDFSQLAPAFASCRRKVPGSVVILTHSAQRAYEISNQLADGKAPVLRLYAHGGGRRRDQMSSQMKELETTVTSTKKWIAVGTPGRVKALVEQGSSALISSQLYAFDMDKNLKTMNLLQIAETRRDVVKLLDTYVLPGAQRNACKLILF